VDPRAVRVVADDLTGACDIAAALLPWPGPVVVETYAGADAPADAALWVRNTQSRTLPVEEARRAVRQALAGFAAEDGVVLKKIDSALRGHVGAELEAAIDAVGAAEGFVLPAIPAVGRTTLGGVQLVDGVPLHATAFAADPLHPVRESEVAVHVERASGRRCRALSLDDVRSTKRLAAAIARGRLEGCTTFACDAVTDADLARALEVLLARPRPAVLAGSLGLGRALRERLEIPPGAGGPLPMRGSAAGMLVVVGSTHPSARRQSEVIAAPAAVCELSAREDAERTGARAAALLARGAVAVLRTPAEIEAGEGARWLTAMGRAVASCVGSCRPGALVLVGGETAHAALRGLRQPGIRVRAGLEPLIVGGELVGGALAGMPVVTKGGSSGDARALVRALAWMEREGR
jgi:uncharacterized protein YgbK (DUF1537 family)